ncbi:MAG: hypothetical protein R3B07_37540 [Polyangiaceae bacterium]
MTLRYTNHRRLFELPIGAWSAADRAQIEAICQLESWGDLLAAYEAREDTPDLEEWELRPCESVDVVDADSGEPVLQIHFFDFGTAYAFKAGTIEDAGGATQHGFELNADFDQYSAALRAAHRQADPKIKQHMDFD